MTHRPLNEIFMDVKRCKEELDSYHDELEATARSFEETYKGSNKLKVIDMALDRVSKMRASWNDVNEYRKNWSEYNTCIKSLRYNPGKTA